VLRGWDRGLKKSAATGYALTQLAEMAGTDAVVAALGGA